MDAFGNIDTKKLEKELISNLQYDIKYKQVDNMKKRAVRSAGSYEQFKAMVDCAHLKTLKSKEIESLKDVRKGWKKENSSANRDREALILESELNNQQLNQKQASLWISVARSESGEFVKPKTPLELERDWRRLPTESEKFAYLACTGVKRLARLLDREGNGDLLEEILRLLLQNSESEASKPHMKEATTDAVTGADEGTEARVEADADLVTASIDAEPSAETETETETEIVPQKETETETERGGRNAKEAESLSVADTIKWLNCLSEMKCFSLTICFVSNELRSDICDWIRARCSDSEKLLQKFSK